MVAHRLPSGNTSSVVHASQRGFERKTLASGDPSFYFFRHDPPGPYRRHAGIKWRQPRRDQIGVDEHRAMCFMRQKLPRKCGFAGAIRSRDDNNLALLSHVRIVAWLSSVAQGRERAAGYCIERLTPIEKPE